MVDTETRTIHEWSYTSPIFNNTPPSPIIQSVQFTTAMNQLRVVFDVPTQAETGLGLLDSVCADHFVAGFVASLGQRPFCTWLSSSELLISLGARHYVNTSTRVELLEPSGIEFEDVFGGVVMRSLPATTVEGRIVRGIATPALFPALPSVLPVPETEIIGPDELGACDLLQADASLSRGYAGRPFAKIAWALDYAEVLPLSLPCMHCLCVLLACAAFMSSSLALLSCAPYLRFLFVLLSCASYVALAHGQTYLERGIFEAADAKPGRPHCPPLRKQNPKPRPRNPQPQNFLFQSSNAQA